MAKNSHEKRGVLRRYVLTALLVATMIFVVVVLVAWDARSTIASGEKTDYFGYYSYGYKIERYYAWNSFRLTFWSSRGMQFTFTSSQLTVEDVVEQRWVNDNAAIYLNLCIKKHDSVLTECGPQRIIFNFHRGEVYTASGYVLWRNWDQRHDNKDWMSDSEFDALLARFEEKQDRADRYPPAWFAPINDPKRPLEFADWEILPQEAKAGEVILSKRNELGILSNFAATPFELDGKRYASVEGFWQMMLYPEGPDDERAKDKSVTWKFTREQVAQMTAFEAKSAGTLAEENMKKLGVDWVTYQGKRFPYRSASPGEHYRLILAAMRAKLNQNPEVKRILLATGDLRLKPDHHGEENPPPEWKYYEIWMQLRSELQKPAR